MTVPEPKCICGRSKAIHDGISVMHAYKPMTQPESKAAKLLGRKQLGENMTFSTEELDQYIRSYPRVNASGYGYSGKYTYQSQVGGGAVTFHRTLEAARKNVAKLLRHKARVEALPEGAAITSR